MALIQTGGNIPTLKLMTLNRPFQIGMLYDYRTDKLIDNILLWSEKFISENLTSKSSVTSTFEICMSGSFTKKADLLGIDDNLKLNILVGLVTLSGSSELLDPSHIIEQQEQFILRYSIITNAHELSKHRLKDIDTMYKEVFNQRISTHVVTDILYGVDIFIIFNRKFFHNENREQIQTSINKLLLKIQTLKILDNKALDLNSDERKLAETLSCKYYGDIQFEPNPTSFKDVVKLFRKVSNLVENNNINQYTKPKQVLIYPLYLLNDFFKAKRRFHEINNGILSYCLTRIENLYYFEISFTNIKNNLSSSKIFRRTEQQMLHICTRLHRMEKDIREKVMKLLPEIRSNLVDEAALIGFLNKLDWLLSIKQKLNEWIEFKVQEINIFTKFIDELRKQNTINVLQSSFQPESDVEFNLRLIVHFTAKADPFLDKVLAYLTENVKEEQDLNINADFWINANNCLSIQKEIDLFLKFVQYNFNQKNIKFFVDEEFIDEYEMRKGVTTILYRNGVPVKFKIPSRPGQPYATEHSCQNTTLIWGKPGYGSESIKKYRIYGKSSVDPQWTLLLTTANATPRAVLSNLLVGNYQFKTQGVTLAGYTDESDASNIIDVANDLSTKYYLSNQPLASEEKNYYEDCKEYCQLTGEPLISVSDETFDKSIQLESTSLIFGIDDNCSKFDLRQFLTEFCNRFNLKLGDIVVKTIQSGSIILHIDLVCNPNSNEKLVLKMVYDKVTEQSRELLHKMKIFFMHLGAKEVLSKIQNFRQEIKLYPEYNRIYDKGHNFWVGPLNDGIDRGNKPYFCPVGWQRYSFYVTDTFSEKFKGWCICYHGTKFANGLSILLSGLKPATIDAHGEGIYVTPSINYAAHPRYAEVKFIESSSQNNLVKANHYVQFVLECRVHPSNIIGVKKETLKAGAVIIDPNINNDIIEWVIDHQKQLIVDFNDPNASIICTGLMTRVTDRHPGLLSASHWWHKSHLCGAFKCCKLGIPLEKLKDQKSNGDQCNIIFN